MSSLQHQRFGIRSEWIRGALEKPEELLQSLGNRQILAIKGWLTQAGIAEVMAGKEEDKWEIILSPFGKILKEFDPHVLGLPSWMFILLNLQNEKSGSLLFFWFANKFQMTLYSQSQLKQRMEEFFSKYSKKTVENISTELKASLLSTPIGNDLHLAIPEGDHFLRQPYTSTPFPLPVFAYALFLQGQTYQRDSFSTMEVEEGEGFPRRIFGLGRRQNEELLDALHSTYNRKLIEVSRTGGLNVVYLKSFTPNQMAKLYYLENKGIEPMQALKQLEKGEE